MKSKKITDWEGDPFYAADVGVARTKPEEPTSFTKLIL